MKIEFKKKFGQNFLTDTNLLAAIAKDSEIDSQTTVVEVGPGAGALTRELAKVSKCVYAFEIDTDLKEILDENLKGYNNVKVVFRDFLKMPNEDLKAVAGTGFAVVANLPYYITSPLITKFLTCGLEPKSLTVMVQKEVGERIVAKPATKDYGVLSVMVQLCGIPEIKRFVGRQMFTPAPNVDSCIVHLSSIKTPKNYERIVEFVKGCFASRRKTLSNNLSKMFEKDDVADVLAEAEIDPSVRAETLSAKEFEKLFQLFDKICQNRL
ncbi:MAG: ribosomal RNA small subunit methyltransferase A [Clostridia bacterium]|nr:ribosomal RNA small subunit methyltransferase A [Clostridia bacterium]